MHVQNINLTETFIEKVENACFKCTGEGVIVTNPCLSCRGQGLVKTKRKIIIDIPAGVEDDTTFHIYGQGMYVCV